MTRFAVRRIVTAVIAALLVGGIVLAADAEAAGPWWSQVAFAGQSVDTVLVGGTGVVAVVGGKAFLSTDAGRTWRATTLATASGPLDEPASGWTVLNGRPARADAGVYRVDEAGPNLGAAGRITAPAGTGYVVAVDAQSVVWRRDAAGGWSRALLLLPEILGRSPPRVTGITSFTDTPLSAAVYVATDGFGVLVSQDGGDDWVRFDSGLPGHVRAVAADAHDHLVFAATEDGLYAHHLQASPAIPAYHDSAYWWRVLGTALVTLAAGAAGGLALRRAARSWS